MIAWLGERRRRWVWALVALVVLLFLVSMVRGRRPQVEVAAAETGPLTLTIAASGKVDGVGSDIGFTTAGRIQEEYVREGDPIQADQTLARIEPGLPSTSETSPIDVLRAPYDGYVVAIYQYDGAITQPGAPVMRVVQRGRVWVTAYLDSEDAADLHPGDRFTCRAGGYLSQPWNLAVEEIGKEAVQREDVPGSARQIRVRLRVLDAGFGLHPGTPVDIDGDVPILRQGLLIPAAAVTRSGAKNYVWVYHDGFVRRREVATGPNNFRQIAVTDGLQTGEQVVVEGKTDLADMTWVQAVPWQRAEAK